MQPRQQLLATIISYKPPSDFNFARYTIMYGSYMPSPALGINEPLLLHYIMKYRDS